MPFTFQYLPDPTVLSAANRGIGYDQYLDRERQYALKEQDMALEAERVQIAREQAKFGQGFDVEKLREQSRQFDVEQGNVGDFRRAQLDAEQFQQEQRLGAQFGLAQQQMEAQQNLQKGTLAQRRQEQIARQLNAEWQSILEHRDEFTPEQFADIQQQMTDKYGALQMPPPVSVPGSEAQPEGEKLLAQYRQMYPDTPWVLDKDGFPKVPSGFKPEFSQKFRDEAHAREMEKLAEQNKQKDEQDAAKAKKAEQDFGFNQHKFAVTMWNTRFQAKQEMLDSKKPKYEYYKKQGIPGAAPTYDDARFNADMEKWSADYDAMFAEWQQGVDALDGGSPLGTPSPAAAGTPPPPPGGEPFQASVPDTPAAAPTHVYWDDAPKFDGEWKDMPSGKAIGERRNVRGDLWEYVGDAADGTQNWKRFERISSLKDIPSDTDGDGRSPGVILPDGKSYIVIDKEDEARRLGLRDGTPIVDSQGRTGVWMN